MNVDPEKLAKALIEQGWADGDVSLSEFVCVLATNLVDPKYAFAPTPVAAPAIPAAITEWRDAWQAHLDATATYNARVAFARANEGERIGSIPVRAEYDLMCDAKNKVMRMLPALFEGISAMPAAPASGEAVAEPDTSQDWAKLDGAVAYHLIERHGEDWADIGAKMEAWGRARFAAPIAAQEQARGMVGRVPSGWRLESGECGSGVSEPVAWLQTEDGSHPLVFLHKAGWAPPQTWGSRYEWRPLGFIGATPPAASADDAKDAVRWRKLMARCWKFDVKFNKDGNPRSITATFRETITSSDKFIEDAGRLIDDFSPIDAAIRAGNKGEAK